MPTKLTPEEKAAKVLERKILAKAKREEVRIAKNAERQAKWEAERQAKREAFHQSMSAEDLADFNEGMQLQTSEQNQFGDVVVKDAFIKSLQDQYTAWGSLSDKQLSAMLSKVRKLREMQQKAEVWPQLQVGDLVKIFIFPSSVSIESGHYGTSFKIRGTTHYGRRVVFSTTRKDWAEQARECAEQKRKLPCTAKVKWIAPEKGAVFVLSSKGAKFGWTVV